MFTTAASLLELTDSESSPQFFRKYQFPVQEPPLFSLPPRPGFPLPSHHKESPRLIRKQPRLTTTPLFPPGLKEKLTVTLRDGRKLIGVLRSWDQFGMFLPIFSPSSGHTTEVPSPQQPKFKNSQPAAQRQPLPHRDPRAHLHTSTRRPSDKPPAALRGHTARRVSGPRGEHHDHGGGGPGSRLGRGGAAAVAEGRGGGGAQGEGGGGGEAGEGRGEEEGPVEGVGGV